MRKKNMETEKRKYGREDLPVDIEIQSHRIR